MPRWIRTPLTVTLVRPLLLAAYALFLAAPASAALPVYRMIWQRTGYGVQYDVTQNTPFQHADSYAVPDGSGAIFTGSAFSAPGHVGVDNLVEHLWSGGPATSSVYEVRSFASTNDFVITGPGQWVEGELHVRARASVSRSGNGQSARLNVDARARSGILVSMGDLIWNNSGPHGSGVLAGVTSSDLEFGFVVSGFFPVGTTFDVSLQMFGLENSSASLPAGWARTDAVTTSTNGLFLEEVGGQVLTLPAGYTLDSPNWGVVDNHFQSLVGVDPAPIRDALRLTAHPNPFTSNSTVSFELRQAGRVRLLVFDVRGRLVRTLADEWRGAQAQHIAWDGRADDGILAPTGLYFARVEAGGSRASQRIALVR